ncbi:MAG TPA: hypothetical protein VFU37_23125, partial [Pyrinomonadaceae bacterium]|nr:hypothetical protein [Pyrinomonadaceae bacterium]
MLIKRMPSNVRKAFGLPGGRLKFGGATSGFRGLAPSVAVSTEVQSTSAHQTAEPLWHAKRKQNPRKSIKLSGVNMEK